MPKQLNADAQAYDREYDAFLKQLEEFHQQRGTAFKRLPRINGKGIDLYLLYVVVTARGGWQKVNSRNEWEDILEDFRLPASCVNASTALKHIYIRYLDTYERINFLGEDGDERTNDGEEDEARSLRVKRSVRALNSVSQTYNHQQHNVSETVRSSSGMSTELYKGSIYERLSLSLSCPLPNEHDFAFNMCTLLSNEGKHTLQLPQCPRIIEFMLAHTGVFRDKETQKYFISNYKEAKGKSLVQFWIDSVEDKSVLDLLSPECYESAAAAASPLFNIVVGAPTASVSGGQKCIEAAAATETRESEEESRCSAESATVCLDSNSSKETKSSEYADSRNEDQRGEKTIKSSQPFKNEDQRGGKMVKSSQPLSDKKDTISSKLEQVLACEVVDLRLGPEDTEIFHLGRDLGLLDSEGTRISQVLHILRNLSFEEVNIPVLAQSNTCLRFLVLCVCSRWGGLAVGALDTLGNIAAEVSMRDPAVDPTFALLLTTVCQRVSSQDRAFVLRSMEVLNRLAMNDPNEEILCCNIDQSVYDQICRFLTIHDIMLLIYTLEALYSLSSLGPTSCNCIVRAKGAVQTLISLLTVEAQSYGPEACIGMKVVETVTGVVSETEATTSTVTTTSQVSTTTTPTAAQTTTTVSTTTPNPTAATTTPAVITNTPKVLPKSSPRIVPPEVEEFVIDWVTKNYDSCPKNAIEQAIVYRHFAASMHSLGRKQGLNPVLLSNCVRKVFGTGVGPSRRPVEDGTEKWHYNGIRRKDGVVVPTLADQKNNSQFNNNQQLTPTPIIPSGTVIPTATIIPTGSIPLRIGTPTTTVVASEALSHPAPTPPQGSILKAQLSAPLRNSPSPVRVVSHQGVVGGVRMPSAPPSNYSSNPTTLMTPQAAPRSDNSSLIKSLLANKVTGGLSSPITTTATHHMTQSVKQPTQHYQSSHQPFLQPKAETSTTNVGQPLALHTSLPWSQVHALSKGPLGPQGLVGNPNLNSRGVTNQGQCITPQKPGGVVQVSRNIQKLNTPDSSAENYPDSLNNKAISFNGICNELMKNDTDSVFGRKVTSFEGILQNGLREDSKEDMIDIKDEPGERKNLLADLLEKTVGGDVLNGVVEKDLRITEKGIQVISHLPFSRINGPSNGQMENSQGGIKRPGTPDTHGGPLKRLAVEDSRSLADSRITLYVSQNGNDGEVLSQGHQVVLNQGHQGQVIPASSLTGGQYVSTQTVVTPQGQMIIQRPASQGNVIVQQGPQIISQGSQFINHQRPNHHTQVITYTTQSQGQIFTTNSPSSVITHAGGQTQVLPAQGTPIISSGSGQVLHQVIAHGQGGQKVILHGGQIGQVLGGQVILPQGGGQNILVQGSNSIQGQVFMQSVSTNNQNPVIVQGTNGHNQVLVQGTGNQGQVLLQGNNGPSQLMVGGVSQTQTVMNTNGQTMIFTGSQGQQVVVGGSQSGQHVVMGGASQGQGQMLVQSSAMGNTVFLAPQHQGGQGTQKTLIILPNPKMVVSSNQSQSGQVVLPRQVVQVVSSCNTTPVLSSPVRTIKTITSTPETTVSSYSPNMVSVQVHTGVAPPPSGPTATPVTQAGGTLSSTTPHIPAPQVLASGVVRRPKSTGLQYVCEWRGCNLVFNTPGQVYHHACKVHCPPHIMELNCQWSGCDSMVRKRFSAMTHIHDRHCNEQLLQILALRRQQISNAGKTDIPIPQTPPPHPGYAPNAAFHAIKRHALEVINQRDAVEKEGPVTKSIRLTAALILRNLVIYSNSGKKLLKGYESELANVAISSMESSRTVGQILYDIHLPDHQAL